LKRLCVLALIELAYRAVLRSRVRGLIGL